MRAKPRKLKKIHQIVALLIAICSLLGVSYAYWDDATTVLGKIDTGKIGLSTQVLKENQICAFEHGNWNTCQNKNPEIRITNNGSIPIEITSVIVKNLRYKAAEYSHEWEVYEKHYDWDFKYDWDLSRLNINKKPVLKNGVQVEKSADINTELRSLNGKIINPDESMDIPLEINYGDLVKEIANNLKGTRIYTNVEGHKNAINNIDVDYKGILELEIQYRQWNTNSGWKESVVTEIPTNWSRATYVLRKEYHLLHTNEKLMGEVKVYPEENIRMRYASTPCLMSISEEVSEEANTERYSSGSSQASNVNEAVETPSISENAESKVEAALEVMEDANKQNESNSAKETISDGSETTTSNKESSSSVSERVTSSTEPSSSVSESVTISAESSSHTSEVAQSSSVGSTSESSEKAESSSSTSEATSANESN